MRARSNAQRRAHLPRRAGGVVRRQDSADEGDAACTPRETRRGVIGTHAAERVDGAARYFAFALEGLSSPRRGPDENLLLVGKTGLSVTKSAPSVNARSRFFSRMGGIADEARIASRAHRGNGSPCPCRGVRRPLPGLRPVPDRRSQSGARRADSRERRPPAPGAGAPQRADPFRGTERSAPRRRGPLPARPGGRPTGGRSCP